MDNFFLWCIHGQIRGQIPPWFVFYIEFILVKVSVPKLLIIFFINVWKFFFIYFLPSSCFLEIIRFWWWTPAVKKHFLIAKNFRSKFFLFPLEKYPGCFTYDLREINVSFASFLKLIKKMNFLFLLINLIL